VQARIYRKHYARCINRQIYLQRNIRRKVMVLRLTWALYYYKKRYQKMCGELEEAAKNGDTETGV